MSHDDKTFGKTFAMVIVILVLISVVIAVVANVITKKSLGEEGLSEREVSQMSERIAPMGRVSVDPSDDVVVAAASEVVREPLAADDVLNQFCNGCHLSGALGAPVVGNAGHWAPRAAQGVATVVKNAIKGLNNMPARGGNPDLTDDEISKAVALMLKQSGQ